MDRFYAIWFYRLDLKINKLLIYLREIITNVHMEKIGRQKHIIIQVPQNTPVYHSKYFRKKFRLYFCLPIKILCRHRSLSVIFYCCIIELNKLMPNTLSHHYYNYYLLLNPRAWTHLRTRPDDFRSEYANEHPI